MIDIIAFDADDTLWHMETLFHVTQKKYLKLLSSYHSEEWISEKLFETEMRNLEHFGYGVKGFTLSMIETAIQLTEGRISGTEIRQILDFGKQMLMAPVELLEHVEDTVKTISGQYPLMLLTKGDLFDQESKIARSGLSRYFKYIEICSTKEKDAYARIIDKYKIDSHRFLMVGNSLKSDILPVLELGGYGVFIPYHLCWEHEKISGSETDLEMFSNYYRLDNIGSLPGLIRDISRN
jgi:putative hydrolase of the HAD superfamily